MPVTPRVVSRQPTNAPPERASSAEGDPTSSPSVHDMMCHERDGGHDDRQESVDLLTPANPRTPEKCPTRTDCGTGTGVPEARARHDSGRRKRKRGQRRKRRPRRNDLTDKVAPKVVNGIVCLMKSKICNVLGSVATGGNVFKPHTIAVDTCSGTI